jgi:hypothetical protein
MNVVCSCVQLVGCGKRMGKKRTGKKIKPRGKTIAGTKTVFVHSICAPDVHAIRGGDTMYYIIVRRERTVKKKIKKIEFLPGQGSQLRPKLCSAKKDFSHLKSTQWLHEH